MVVEKERGQYNMKLMNASGGKRLLSAVFGGIIRRWAQIKSSFQRVTHQDSKSQRKPEREVRRFIHQLTTESATGRHQPRLSPELRRLGKVGRFAPPYTDSTEGSLRGLASAATEFRNAPGGLPMKSNVSMLISRGLEQKRPFLAPFLTLNHFDFSALRKKPAVFLFGNVNGCRMTEVVYSRGFVT
jgi:hypothetical protein